MNWLQIIISILILAHNLKKQKNIIEFIIIINRSSYSIIFNPLDLFISYLGKKYIIVIRQFTLIFLLFS